MRLAFSRAAATAPGLNAALRAIVRYRHAERGAPAIGFADGWRGVLDNEANKLAISAARARSRRPCGSGVMASPRSSASA